jgi:hypothetical protein
LKTISYDFIQAPISPGDSEKCVVELAKTSTLRPLESPYSNNFLP